MKFLKSSQFVLVVSVFLLISIPLTTYIVITVEQTNRSPQASTICESDCNQENPASNVTAVKGDLSKDSLVNEDDVAILVSQMGKKGQNEADLNEDSVVNQEDLAILRSNWTKTQ